MNLNIPIDIMHINSMVLGPEGLPTPNSAGHVLYPVTRVSLRALGGGWYWQHTTITFDGQPPIHVRGAVRLDDSISEMYKGDPRLSTEKESHA